ncbi:restriction endonuclease subunit S [Legionella cincinnatiensis]|uniref:EcoKI restriction-modification system protein HsdS n=1 Tax=Legionella cincinnatiensis TaxID=28085 RepID=A0A378IHC8_9GAMM|nr:restriction endonuclease subunit S [Legionella cincinnatiensis]KTC93546.1 ecoKI restriction-modification system protein HsdS [Legionella cincinnatiensis]STX34125.1 type I restriction-modification system (methylase_S) [Legionella cincinnatiensis]
MELNEGYKQTEVGLLPKDWDVVAIKDIASRNKKWSFTGGPFGSNLKSTDYTNSGIRIIQLQNIGDGKFLDDYAIYTSIEKANELLSCNIYPGDLILSKMGDPVARACLVPNIHSRYLMCSDGIRLAIDGTEASFFYYNFINSPSFRKQAEEVSTGSTRKRIGLTQLKKLLLPKPSLAEQTAIAKALSDADAWIQSLTQLIAKKRQIKQGALHNLLSPKDNWFEIKLKDVAILKARIGWQGLTTSEYLSNGNYYLVTGTEFKDGYIDWANCYYVDEERYKQDKSIQLQQEDVLVTKDGTIGKVAYINALDKPATLNSGVFVIRPKKEAFEPLFFYYILCSKYFSTFLNQLTAGSTINHLYQKDFVDFSFKSPPSLEEQKSIAFVLSDMDNEISGLERKLKKAKQIKQGMMQNLLTGRIRLI